MDYAWIMRGLCIDYAWIMHRSCMDYAWILHGLRMDYALCIGCERIMHGLCIDYARIKHIRIMRRWSQMDLKITPTSHAKSGTELDANLTHWHFMDDAWMMHG